MLGGLFAPVFYTLVLIPNLIFNSSAYENMGAILGLYLVSVFAGAIFGCIFGTILGAILGITQGIITSIIVRHFSFPPRNEVQLKYTLTVSAAVVSLIIVCLYFAKVLPGLLGIMFILPVIIVTLVNVWIIQRIGDWYLSQLAFFLPVTEEFQRADAGDEP